MSTANTPYHFSHLPKVSKETLKALVHDIATDPTYSQRVFNSHNNQNHELMSAVVAEANKQSEGDMERQMSFIEGAQFVLAALQRQVDTEQLEALLEEEPQVLVIELFSPKEPPRPAA